MNEVKQNQPSNFNYCQLRILGNPMNFEWKQLRLREALDLLASYSLIRSKRADEILFVHPLLKRAVHARLDKSDSQIQTP